MGPYAQDGTRSAQEGFRAQDIAGRGLAERRGARFSDNGEGADLLGTDESAREPGWPENGMQSTPIGLRLRPTAFPRASTPSMRNGKRDPSGI